MVFKILIISGLIIAGIYGGYTLYRRKHPEKYYGGEVFLAKLDSVTPNINVDTDLSKAENIDKAEKECVEKILIQKTSNKNFYREIITGKLIPVRIITYWYEATYCDGRIVLPKYNGIIDSCGSCVFVRKNVKIYNDRYFPYAYIGAY